MKDVSEKVVEIGGRKALVNVRTGRVIEELDVVVRE